MKKILRVCTLIAAFFAMVLGFLNLIGIITTQWAWISFAGILLAILMSREQFSIKGEPNKTKNARILGIVWLLAGAVSLLAFIKSVLK
ncbi:hypothetical protein [Clostridium tagluense]|uniref:hypothetical protein n=1 Tax=Clostridium tagluense TaxID=360422 RepID=UPI001C6E61EB|nr:hypothetical protein [Clostridium tagluense]MBW9159656.1 hypothetical protein [Clostridium tagluense]WLC68416.1 hypothetical protein KTC93_25780 [Clostridium tagluense]